MDNWATKPLRDALPSLPIFAIDLASTDMERLENSLELDAVAKVILSIMKLVQQKLLDIGSVREVIRMHFPKEQTTVQREYMVAAITYIAYTTIVSDYVT